jgi:superfamily II DNA or RNA helicase
MNIELKAFQDNSVRDLLKARAEMVDGLAQSIALSSPTGSGKTITLAALIKRLIEGDDAVEELSNPECNFLCFSHDPELDKQGKILQTTTRSASPTSF